MVIFVGQLIQPQKNTSIKFPRPMNEIWMQHKAWLDKLRRILEQGPRGEGNFSLCHGRKGKVLSLQRSGATAIKLYNFKATFTLLWTAHPKHNSASSPSGHNPGHSHDPENRSISPLSGEHGLPTRTADKTLSWKQLKTNKFPTKLPFLAGESLAAQVQLIAGWCHYQWQVLSICIQWLVLAGGRASDQKVRTYVRPATL